MARLFFIREVTGVGELLNELRQLNLLSVMIRLCLAMVFGGAIGLERGRKGRAAGFRTYMLVCLGATLTMLLGQYYACMQNSVWADTFQSLGGSSDISRFSAQVINGIGFLGAGTILVTGRQEVKGMTTAACLWSSACMGLAIGAGFYECVMLGFLLIFLCVHLLPGVERFLMENAKNMSLYVEFQSLDDISNIINCIKAHEAHIYEVEIDRGRTERGKNPSAVFTIRLKNRQRHSRILADISDLDTVRTIDEI